MSTGLQATAFPTSAKEAMALAMDPAQKAQEEAELREAAQQFEGLFLAQMWKEMRKTVQKGELFSGGFGEDMFESMLDQAYADQASSNGSLGLSELLVQQFSGQNTVRPGASLSAYKLNSAQNTGFTMPVEGEVSSPFGERTHPIKGTRLHHDGLDLAAEQGSQVVAARDGEVTFAGENGGYGNLVEIKHADGYTTRYAHLDEIEVQAGQSIKSGQELGTVGSTGLSTGPHLHFEIRDQNGEPTDPMQLVSRAFSTVS